jgi:16S rRNA (guanine(966)-N(2))-methyltransferase RsmD
MRIIAGEYRGRLLKTRPGRDVRPTSDKLRETLFNVLRTEVPESVFIDCYAGSGAVGLEAVSRGASQVFLIERDPAAVRVIGQNIASLYAAEKTREMRGSVGAALKKLATEGVQAHICFLDPPYAELARAIGILEWLAANALMRSDGLIILEHARRDKTPEQIGTQSHEWRRIRLLEQGSSALSFYRRSSPTG